MTRMLLSLLCMIAFAASANAGEYIVKFKDKSASPMMLTQITGVSVLDSHERGQLAKVSLKKEEAKTLSRIMSHPSVEYVVENFELQAFSKPIEMNNLRQQWALAKVNAEKAWNLARSRGSKKVIVAVIDTGVDSNHESLKPNMIAGYDFADNDSDPHDEIGQTLVTVLTVLVLSVPQVS